MRVRHANAWRVTIVGGGLLLYACNKDPVRPASDVQPPVDVQVEAVGTTSVRVSWTSSGSHGITGYDVQRRADLIGPFATIAENIPEKTGRITYFDTTVEPDRFYGYRVIARAGLGAASAASVVGGTKTPPMHGLIITTNTTVPNEASSDPDGYTVNVRGPRDTITVPLATNGERRISPLRPGTYVSILRGLAGHCGFKSGDSTKTVAIPDSGVTTQARINYELSCRDPKRGSIVLRYDQQGDTTDANGVRLSIVGLFMELDPVDTSRVFFHQQTITTRNETLRFDNLRKGSFEVSLDDISPLCRLAGLRKRNIEVKALSLDTVSYNLECIKPTVPEDTVNRPLLLSHLFAPTQAPTGTRVAMVTQLDLRSRPQISAVGVQTAIRYNQSVLRYDSARVGDFDLLAPNATTPGTIIASAVNTDGRGLPGLITVGRIWFTVIGATGATSRSSTTITEIVGPNVQRLDPQTRVREATFTVGPLASNTPPIARANGPYTGRGGTPVQFSSTGSSDPDGSIASYAWTFGDGASAAGATPSHTYTTAGTYTARLTVTDNLGATASDQATVTIIANNNQSPVARITGPTTGTVGATLTFSGSTSSDADGTIAGYAWDFGDTQTGSGASVTHAFATAGSYTVRLTVTDNQGATNSAQQAVVITNGGGGNQTPFLWKNEFGTMNPTTKEVDLTISLDLSTDIPDTPGAEALQSFIVDSLKWNPAILEFVAFNWGPGQSQNVDASAANSGKLRFSGSTIPANSSGIINVASVRLKAIGAIGATAATASTVGALIGTTATGSFNYRSKTRVQEDTFAIPAGAVGTVSGAVLRASNNAPIAGATVVVTPTSTGTALPAVVTDASGQYTMPNVPVGDGSVLITGGLPAGCTTPAQQSYTGLTTTAPVTVSFSVNCQSQQPGTYPVSGTWGPITTGGPTGRQVTLSLSIDMGPAPGRPDVNGSNQDELVGIQLVVSNFGQFTYASRTLPDPNMDLGAINQNGGNLNVAVTSTQSATAKGLVNFVVLRFNIPTGFAGPVNATMTLTEILAGIFATPINVTSSGVVVPLPTLTVP